jgi:hypothetical protein
MASTSKSSAISGTKALVNYHHLKLKTLKCTYYGTKFFKYAIHEKIYKLYSAK